MNVLFCSQTVMERQTETIEASDLPVHGNQMEEEKESGSKSETEEDGRGAQIPMHRWVMHGSVMFGRELCYAMETALVMPVLLQIGKRHKHAPVILSLKCTM